jgi:hypothetical protein
MVIVSMRHLTAVQPSPPQMPSYGINTQASVLIDVGCAISQMDFLVGFKISNRIEVLPARSLRESTVSKAAVSVRKYFKKHCL